MAIKQSTTPKYGTLSRLNDIAKDYGCTIHREGPKHNMIISKNGINRTIIDIPKQEVISSIRMRTFEEWQVIIKENASLI